MVGDPRRHLHHPRPPRTTRHRGVHRRRRPGPCGPRCAWRDAPERHEPHRGDRGPLQAVQRPGGRPPHDRLRGHDLRPDRAGRDALPGVLGEAPRRRGDRGRGPPLPRAAGGDPRGPRRDRRERRRGRRAEQPGHEHIPDPRVRRGAGGTPREARHRRQPLHRRLPDQRPGGGPDAGLRKRAVIRRDLQPLRGLRRHLHPG